MEHLAVLDELDFICKDLAAAAEALIPNSPLRLMIGPHQVEHAVEYTITYNIGQLRKLMEEL